MTNRDNRIELILAGLLHDKILFIETMSRFEDRVFPIDEYNLFVSCLKSFYEQHRKPPNRNEFEIFVDKKDLAKFPFLSDVFYNPDIDSAVLRAKLYERYQTIQTLDFLGTVENQIENNSMDVKVVFQEMKKMVLKTSQPDRTFIELTDDVANDTYIQSRDFRVENTTPLCFRNISIVAQGGIADCETLIFIAPPNRGKTLYLINELFQGMLNGEKCLYLSMENEAETILSRLYSRILLMSKAQQRQDDNLCKKYLRKFFRMVPTPVIMYKPADTFTVADLDLWLEEYELTTGIKFNRVIVDYLNKFKKVRASRASDDWNDVRKLADDFRALGIARKMKMLTAGQTGRGGVASKEGVATESVNETHIAGGFGVFETADIVLAYSETASDRQRGGGRVSILKMRESGGRGREFVTATAPWIGLMTDDASKLFPPEVMDRALSNPDKAFGELAGLAAVEAPAADKSPYAGRRKSGTPKVAELGAGSKPVVDNEINV